MDTLLSKCVEFIALEGSQGTTLGAVLNLLEVSTRPSLANIILHSQPAISVQGAIPGDVSSLSEAELKAIVVTASKELRERFLGVTDPSISLSEVQLNVLELIGKCREKGILQHQLSAQTKIDPRNLFHHIKKLECHSLVQRTEVMATEKKKTINTNLIVLKRFIRDSSFSSNPSEDGTSVQVPTQYMREVCKLLKSAKDNILIESDVINSLALTRRKRWRDLRARLEDGGYIQKVKITIAGSDEDQDIIGIQLLKDYPSEKLEEDEDDDEDSVFSNKPVALAAELATEYQFYKIIKAQTNGITQTELSNITGLSRKTSAAIVKELVKLYGIHAVPEMLGKQITYRLYAQDPVNSSNQLPINVPSPVTPTNSQEKRPNTEIIAGDNEQMEIDSQQPTTVAQSEPASSSEVSDKPSFGLKTPPVPALLEGIKRVVKNFPITTDSIKRRKILIDILENKKIITLHHVWRSLADLERDEKGPNSGLIDRKTVNRLVALLAKEKIIETFKLSIPKVAGGHKTYDIVMHSSIKKTDEVVKQYIAYLRETEFSSHIIKPAKPTERLVVVVDQVDRLQNLPVTPKKVDEETQRPTIAVALKYGFLKAKMTRAKMFHQYLWSVVREADEDVPGWSFRLSEIVQGFSLDLYLTVVGQTRVIPGLEELMGRGFTIAQLPENIRQELFYRRAFARRINLLLDVLQKLKLIFKKEGEEELFYLAENAEIKDITVPTPITRQYTFANTTDIMLFWTELEYIALHKILEQDEEEFETPANMTNMVEGLPELQNRASWNLPALRLNRQQRAVLDKTPQPQSRDAFRALAAQTALTPAEVAGYYKRLSKRKTIKPTTVEQPQEEGTAPPEVQPPKQPKKKAERGKRKTGAGSSVFPIRNKWTPIEEHHLMNVFITEMNKSDGWNKLEAMSLVPYMSSDLWEAVSAATNKPGASCYRRLKTLVKKFPEPRRMVQIAKAQAALPAQSQILLPSSTAVLDSNFVVEKLSQGTPKPTFAPSNSALPDIIKIILLTPESDYNSNLAIKLLSNFTEEEIVTCFEKIAAQGYIARTRAIGISRGYQLSAKFQQYFRDYFPPKFLDEERSFNKLIQLQLPKQLPLIDVEDVDLSNYLQIHPMCSGGAVGQCLNFLIDETVKITPIVPNSLNMEENDQVHKHGRGGVKDHLLLLGEDSQTASNIPKNIRRLYGVASEKTMLKQLNWQMVIERGDNYEDADDITTSKRKELSDASENESAKRRKIDDAGDEASIPTPDTVLEHVKHAGTSGISLANLAVKLCTTPNSTLIDTLCTLQSDRRVLQVDDQTQHKYVATEFESRWSLAPKVAVRPWLSLTGTLNKEVYESLHTRLLFTITRNPAIQEDKLHELLPIISPIAVNELLEHLEKTGKVYHKDHVNERPSLFSTFNVFWNNCDATPQKMYFATGKV